MNSMPVLSNRRWLVVDDNAPLAGFLTLMLSELGLAHVEGFGCPREAAARFSADASAFDLVLTDRDMPGLDGLELARSLHAQSPGTKIVLISAHTDDLADEVLRRAGICAVLAKPFSLARLEALVRSLMCEPASLTAPFHSTVACRAA